MHLSERVTRLKPSATLEVSARAAAMRAEGKDVIAFGAGEPDFDTPDHIKHAAVEAIHAGWTKYVSSAGDPKARKVIAEKLRSENNLTDITADHIVVSAGAKMALYLALECLVDPGDEVILPVPTWVSYAPMSELAGGRVIEVDTTAETGFRMSASQLRDVLTPRSRVLILNSPSNPTGGVYGPADLQAIAKVVNEFNTSATHELVVISDEIYEKLVYDDEAEFASIGQWIENGASVTINGLSKSYAMTGWRVGYAAAGEKALAKAMAKLQAQMNTCATACCFPVIVHALKEGAADIEKMRQVYVKRSQMIGELIAQLPKVTCCKPAGAFYAFPDVSAHFGTTSVEGRGITNSVEFAEALLAEARVAVVPGDDFGGCGPNHIRLSYATSDENIVEGLARIRQFLDKLR